MPSIHVAKTSFPNFLNSMCLSLILALASLLGIGTASAAETRLRECFDFDWRFHLGEEEGDHLTSYREGDWRKIDLPHDWSVELPFSPEFASGTGYLPGGVGWYRKSFQVPEEWQDREVILEFDGVHRNSEVWINGQLVGGRPYGYIPYAVRLTPHLKYGQSNVVVVRVTRKNVADSRWYPGSGIYRHVWLTVTDKVHIEQWGTFVTTPRVTSERADITVSNTVVNEADEDASVRVVTQIVGPEGRILSNQATSAPFAADHSETLAHWHTIENPIRWSTDSPTLYTAVSRIFRNGLLVDEVRTSFGIRTFRFDADDGFFLNGRNTLIKGLCLHHDAGVVGAAVPDKMLERRLRLVKALGANAVRCSHNPMADELYSLCDRIGLLVMDEAFDEWELGKRKWVKGRNVGRAGRFGYNEHFEQWAERDAADMVRRSRNHPSIILWSIGNEIDYPGDPYAHPEFFDPAAPPVEEGSPSATRLAVVAPKLIAAVKKHDPTRPVTMALSSMPTANGIGLANMLDVVGYNYQEQFYRQDHVDFPGRVIYGSENGRGRRSWQAVRDNDYISSLYLWVGFDFLGEAGEWPNHGSRAGVFDTRGMLKPQSFYQKMAWSDEPAVQLLVGAPPEDEWQRRRGFRLADRPRLWKAEAGSIVPVIVTTNCEEIRLTLNGNPIESNYSAQGGFHLARVPYAAGELNVSALRDKEIVTSDTLHAPGTAARLVLSADRKHLLADGQDVAHVEVKVVDENGVTVADSELELTVQVTGAGKLLGIDNGDQDDPTPLASTTKKFWDGRMLAVVQSGREPGGIVLEAAAEGLPNATWKLTAVE